jgi:WD40 repeat protein
MAVTREIIDLISDSDDDSQTKKATSTLQAFVPQKENAASSTSTSRPHYNEPIPLRPDAPVASPNPTKILRAIRPNATISEILSHGLQSFARCVGSFTAQSRPQEADDIAPAQRHSTAAQSGVFATLKASATAPVPLKKQDGKPIWAGLPVLEPKAQKAGRINGPLHEERQRRAEEYHRRSEEQRKEAIDPVAAPTQRSAFLSIEPNNNLYRLHGLRGSPQANGPETKRRKLNHKVDEDLTGMIEARRLSATAISIAHGLATHDETSAPATSKGNLTSDVVPKALSSSADSVENNKYVSAATKAQHQNNKFNFNQDSVTQLRASILAKKPEAERKIVSASPRGGGIASESDDSPDEIPAKPVRKCSSTEHRDASESDSPDEIPARPVQKRSSTGHRDTSRIDSPDQISARPVQKHSSTGHRDVHARHVHLAAPPPTATNPYTMPKKAALETEKPKQVVPRISRATGNGKQNAHGTSKHGTPYSTEEDNLLAHLKEMLGIAWEDMPKYFSGRTQGSLQVRYSSKIKNRKLSNTTLQHSSLRKESLSRSNATAMPDYTAPSRRHPKTVQRNDGFVSWDDIRAQRKEDKATIESATPPAIEPSTQVPGLGLDVSHPASIPRILRSREIGNTGRRNWSSTARMVVSDELQNHVLDTIGPRRFFHGASHDVTCVAWAPDGNKFAAGAIAIDDEGSMQYNRPNNLLLGDIRNNSLQELPEHHVARPTVNDSQNVNSLHAMQETQDPRLFKTVAAVEFSEDSRALYSAGGDGVVRMYDASSRSCLSSYKQEAEVVLLASNSKGLLASGSHRSDDGSISIVRCHSDYMEPMCQLGPSRTEVQSSLPIFPSSLKWGTGRFSHFLLAGFASDSYDEDRLAAGEVVLWDSLTNKKLDLPAARNVFDVAWNPCPSSGSSLFAVACAQTGKINRCSIELFAPNQGRAARVLQWDCPAFDINDVLYCPHDDNLIAAGATDGKVYVWDKRRANRDQEPLHILAHGSTKNVLDPGRDLEIADTGVRFLSWSATGNRLYSGSSDGTVKVWNPYRAPQDVLVRDVATFDSAVMSGAFGPDYRDLLIGEDQGQLNLLSIDREARSVRAAKKFDYYPAPVLAVNEDKLAPARELLATGQIEIRPMGVLPINQAVQGKSYQGPFLALSDDKMRDLEDDFRLASEKQRAMRAHVHLLEREVSAKTKKAIKAVDMQELHTRQALERAAKKRDDYATLQPAASLLQKTFRDSLHERWNSTAGTAAQKCRLDCNYLPAAGDEDGEAPDDRRSEQRIPSGPLSQRKFCDTSDMTNAESAEAGLTSKCSVCTGPAAKSKLGLPICERCTLSRSRLTARCEHCEAPIRPNLNNWIQPNTCERCDFHCFRCGKIATVSPAGDMVTCESCDLQWEAGVLGYEVKGGLGSTSRMKAASHKEVIESLDQHMVIPIGEDERERLAGRWKVALVDSPGGS